jgi:AbrB family looped-hinge helix DNA binding protein
MERHLPGTKIAEQLWTRPGGATMREVIKATGGPQYNKLKELETRGFIIRRVKEGNETRYFATPPAARTFEATVTSQGQMTIPKEVRERLGLRGGGKLRLVLEANDRIVVAPMNVSVQGLFGVLGKPPRRLTLAEIDEVIEQAAVDEQE